MLILYQRSVKNSYYEKIDGIDICINEKIPFLLPENWHWERLGNISTIARGGSPRPILRKATQDKIPIAKCANPECGRTILYSKNPREKLNVTVRIAEPGYTGPTYRCAHCNTMLVVIEKPKVAAGYVALPIIAANA